MDNNSNFGFNTGEKVFDWARNVSFAVTICDTEGKILYMNEKSVSVFAKYGNLIGCNLKDCHSAASWEIITRLLSTGGSNTYTIRKNGKSKLIYQTPWYAVSGTGTEKRIGGLVEISIELPPEMPHYVRE